MAVLDTTQRQAIRDAMMRSRPIGIAKADLRAAVDATDTWLESNLASLNTAVPEPFRSVSTTDQKTMLLCYVLLKRAGLLGQGGI
jgi:hypothetical protein